MRKRNDGISRPQEALCVIITICVGTPNATVTRAAAMPERRGEHVPSARMEQRVRHHGDVIRPNLPPDRGRDGVVVDLTVGQLSLIHISEPTRLLSISYA